MLLVVLGLKNVAMTQQSLITRIPKASRPAQVSSRHVGLTFMKFKIQNTSHSLACLTNIRARIVGSVAPPATVKPVGPVNPNSICPACGTVKKTKKRSCCARGGAWFNKCGDEGDSKFDHTWTEGVQSCAGKLTTY